ncbi:Phage integrase family protein [Fontibacillus panacisegetis]|uniref:Phage integrase family protein n=1 Tax=Fontibacillus panacisegetis TaxID=670482 RepID=A0A1G7NJW8_9BACL|nr:tyrosine-type recombinase/integrase [Fontibacillus panacisegetis]SDF73589.1 Phage integrase family protein [Fontibacillus panacisegetis]
MDLRLKRKHKLAQDEIKKLNKDTYYHDFIFAKTEHNKGYPELIKTIHNRMRRLLLLRLAGLNEKLSPHSLRHTHVSLLAEAGADIFQIIERLGHSNDEQIRTVYLHVTKTMEKEAALKVYNEIKIDFVDSLLFAYSKIGGHTVFTFEKKLNRMLDELRNA